MLRDARQPTAEGEPATWVSEPTTNAVVAEFPETAVVDEVNPLVVQIRATLEGQAGIPIETVEVGEVLQIWVQPRKGFILEGQNALALEVPAAGEESLPVMFRLRAVAEGEGLVYVVAFDKGGQSLGRLAIRPQVVSAAMGAAAPAVRSEATLAPVTVKIPDLTLFVEEHNGAQGPEFEILLTSEPLNLNLEPYGPIRFRADPAAYFTEFFKDIERLQPRDPATSRTIAARGADLFANVLPPPLQERIWALRDRITSVIVQSDEPWVPWELCKLQGREDGRIVEGEFLCEKYQVTRWMPGEGFTTDLPLAKMALVVPADSGLPLAQREKDSMLGLAGGSRSVQQVPANKVDVMTAMANGDFDAWHFSGHGAAAATNQDRSAILLEGGERLSPEDVSGEVANVGATRPLVFLNACQVGQGGMGLTGIAGWASRFVRAGAGAFVGTYWSVYDQPAFEFAEALYGNLIGRKPMGEAVREARAKIRTHGDLTWLAYTVYAHPLATCGGP